MTVYHVWTLPAPGRSAEPGLLLPGPAASLWVEPRQARRFAPCRQEALARREAGEAGTEIGRTYNVSHSTISRLRSPWLRHQHTSCGCMSGPAEASAGNAMPSVAHRAIADGGRGGAIRIESLPVGIVGSGAGEDAAVVAGGRPGSTTTRVPTLMRP